MSQWCLEVFQSVHCYNEKFQVICILLSVAILRIKNNMQPYLEWNKFEDSFIGNINYSEGKSKLLKFLYAYLIYIFWSIKFFLLKLIGKYNL